MHNNTWVTIVHHCDYNKQKLENYNPTMKMLNVVEPIEISELTLFEKQKSKIL